MGRYAPSYFGAQLLRFLSLIHILDYDYFYDFLTNYEENVYAKVEANAAQ